MSSTSSSDKSKVRSSKDKESDKIDVSNQEVSGGSSGSSSNSLASISNYYNDFFENFRQNMQNIQNIIEETWPNSVFPTLKSFSPFEVFDRMTDTRIPLCDVMDKGDRYEVTLEIPGIDKDKVDVKATKNSVTISGRQSEKTKEKGKNYVYSERSYKSFHRQIPFPQEIVPSKITAKVNNGVLEVDLPKKQPSRANGTEEYKVDIT
ncbi:MAG: Hsp20/alpha crystallin family protein [Candidatus Nitrosocosmicus sp.]